MRANNFWGGFLQGLGQGLDQQHRRKQQEEALKLKQDLAKREAEQYGIKKSARTTLKRAILDRVGPETMPQAAINPEFQERAAGDEPLTGEPFTDLKDSLMRQRNHDVSQANINAAMIDLARPLDLPRLMGMTPRRANSRQRLVGLPPDAEAALARQMGLSPERYQAVTGRPYPLAQQPTPTPAVPPARSGLTRVNRPRAGHNVAYADLLKQELARQPNIGIDEPISAIGRAKLRAWALVGG